MNWLILLLRKNWYKKRNKIGQGKNNVIRHLEENPQIAQELDRLIREKLLTPITKPIEEKDEEEPDLLDA